MNAKRRSQISTIREQLQALRDQIEEVKSEEEGAFKNMPESFQTSERGDKVQKVINGLSNASDYMEEALGALEVAGEL